MHRTTLFSKHNRKTSQSHGCHNTTAVFLKYDVKSCSLACDWKDLRIGQTLSILTGFKNTIIVEKKKRKKYRSSISPFVCRPFFYLEHCVLAGLYIGIWNKFCGVAQQLLESIMAAEDGDPYTDEGRSKTEGVKVTFSLVFMHLTLKSSLYHSCAPLYWCLSLFVFVMAATRDLTAVNWICRFVFLLFFFVFSWLFDCSRIIQ